MSAELERIKRAASGEIITDPAQIASLTEHFLGRSLRSLVPPTVKERNYMTILANDMAKGFDCDPKDIMECSMGDVLMMFSWEDEFTFFNRPYENEYTYHFGIKAAAGNCIYLAGIFHNYRNRDIHMKALMRVQLYAFVRFLKKSLRDRYTSGGFRQEELKERNVRIDEAMKRMMGFFGKHDVNEIKNLTLGHVLEKSFIEATKIWSCHIEELTKYAVGVVNGYNMADTLFMDCISNALVRPNPSRYSRGIELLAGGEDDFIEIIYNDGVHGTGKEFT